LGGVCGRRRAGLDWLFGVSRVRAGAPDERLALLDALEIARQSDHGSS
jgi:hypothetical protein